MNVHAVFQALPISGIEAQWIARLNLGIGRQEGEFLTPEITYLEPPVGVHVPFVDPVDALTLLLRHPPKALIEFFVGLADDLGWAHTPDGNHFPRELLDNWRELMRPVAERLEKEIGEQVYHFADPDCEYDDDNCLRFLALHCYCTLLPESNFVDHLIEATGAQDVGELKAALIDARSYTHPFKMNDAFVGIEVGHCSFRYTAPGARRRVGIVFCTLEGRIRAEEIASQQLTAEVIFQSASELIPDDWIKSLAPYCNEWVCRYGFDDPIELLAQIDELHVVADRNLPKQGFDLCVSPVVEKLMWHLRCPASLSHAG